MLKNWMVWMLALALVIVVAGCGSNQDGGSQGGSQAGPGESNALPEPVDLYLYSSSGGSPEWFDKNYGIDLKKKFPYITFHVMFPKEISISDYLATKEPLDIIFGSYTSAYSSVLNLDLQSDISDLIELNKVDLNAIEPTVIDLQRQIAKGGIYALPAFIGTSGLYYNKDLFDKFGVSYPTDDMTWDDVYELAVKLTRKDGQVQYYGFANDNRNYLLANQLSLDLVDPKTLKTNFTSDGWKRIVQQFAKFMTIPGYDVKEATVAAFNTKGTVAMATNYTGCCGSTPGKAVTNWGVVEIPDFPEKPNTGPQAFPNYWYMSSISKQRNVAFEVISYIASKEFQTILNSRGLATALKDTELHKQYGKDLPFYDGKNVSALFPKPHAKMSNVTEYHTLAAKELNNAINEMVTKGIDINTALRTAAEKADQLIQTAEEAKSK